MADKNIRLVRLTFALNLFSMPKASNWHPNFSEILQLSSMVPHPSSPKVKKYWPISIIVAEVAFGAKHKAKEQEKLQVQEAKVSLVYPKAVANGVVEKPKKKKRGKSYILTTVLDVDPLLVGIKRPLSAYMIFNNHRRPHLTKGQPGRHPLFINGYSPQHYWGLKTYRLRVERSNRCPQREVVHQGKRRQSWLWTLSIKCQGNQGRSSNSCRSQASGIRLENPASACEKALSVRNIYLLIST